MKRIVSLYKKEMKDVLRDKKTILMMVVVPLILYPLIMFGTIQIMSMIADSQETKNYCVGIGFETMAQEFADVLAKDPGKLEYQFEVISLKDSPVSEKTADSRKEMEKMLIGGEMDAYLTAEQEKSGDIEFQIHYLSSEQDSGNAADMLEEELDIFKEQMQQEMMQELASSVIEVIDSNHPEEIQKRQKEYEFKKGLLLYSTEISYEDMASTEESVGSILGSILPFLLIISLLMGAMYPAIDVTAGERERGTLETMLTLPVKNTELLAGKFLAVATIAVVSAVLNMVSMSFMGFYLYESMAVLGEDISMNVMSFLPAFFVVFLCVLTFALLLSALSMCFCSFARSFKEANNYITPLMLVVMIAGYAGFIPNIKLNATTAMIPVVNISLLIRDIFQSSPNYTLVAIVLLTNVIYALIAVFILGRIYNSEQILFGSEGGGFHFLESRKNIEKGGLPSAADAILVVSIVFLAFLYFGSLLQMKFLMKGVALSEFMIAGIVIFAAVYGKCDGKKLFSLRRPSLLAATGSIFLSIGGYLIMMVIAVFLSQMLPGSSQAVENAFGTMLDGVGFWETFLVLAVVAPICEELVFRGYFYGSLKAKGNIVSAVLISSAVFGIYHMSLLKFFTTGFLGLLLCLAVEWSGSLVSSILMHSLNNAMAAVLMFYSDRLEDYFPVLAQEFPKVSDCLITGMLGIVLAGMGGFLLYKNREGRKA